MPPLQSLHGIPTASSAGSSSSRMPPPIIATSAATAASAELPSTSWALSTPMATPFDQSSGVSASMLCNLLPNLGQGRKSAASVGIYVGEGFLPVPAKLGGKITRWKFVEMVELLPEFWSPLTAKEPAADPTVRQGTVRRRRTVMDIATWIQCFATYVSVMSMVHPHAVPELLAYLIFILRASQDFGGVAWVTYDTAFRWQAFITGNHQWSKVNPSLYSICFSGVARTGTRCELCLSRSHPTFECTLVGDTDSRHLYPPQDVGICSTHFHSSIPPAPRLVASNQVTKCLQELECGTMSHVSMSLPA